MALRLRPSGGFLGTLFKRNSRSYGGAAAALIEDDQNYEDWADPLPQKRHAAQSVVATTYAGIHWVVFGNPGVDKTAFASKAAKLLNIPHISMGSLVREYLLFHSQLSSFVKEGKLLPDDVIFNILFNRLEQGASQGETGFVLDGFPRTRLQAEVLDHVVDIDLAINLKSREDYVKKMYLGSLQNQDNLKEKLRLYKEQNEDLEEYYFKQKKLLNFEVPGDIQEAMPGLLAALDLKDVDPTPKQITAKSFAR